MTKPTPPSGSGTNCPRCGTHASGAFCANCGATLKQAGCASCGADLSPGARFCHRCGAEAGSSAGAGAPVAGAAQTSRGAGGRGGRGVAGSAGAARTSGPAAAGATPSGAVASRDPLPWAVAAIALVALIALIAGQKFGSRSGGGGGAPPAQVAAQRAPDISGMTPRQMTDRLFNMVMTLHEAGKTDSASFIALTMAIPAFDMHDSLDLDLRYDLGRIAEVTGAIDLAKAQADTILQQHPTHLLGLALSANVARILGDSATLRSLNQRILAAEKSELASNLHEYAIHKNDVDRALTQARQGGSQ